MNLKPNDLSVIVKGQNKQCKFTYIKTNNELTLEEWARKHGVSTLWDKGDSKNRQFLKRLDEARAAFHPKKQFRYENI